MKTQVFIKMWCMKQHCGRERLFTMKTRALSLLLCLCLLFVPFATAAADGTAGTTHTVSTADALQQTVNSADSGDVIQLGASINFGTLTPSSSTTVVTGVTIPKGKTLTLDLNGFSLSANLATNGNTYGAAQVVRNEGTLTILDSSEEQDGSIAATTSYGCTATVRNQEGTLTVESGSISCEGGNALRNQNGKMILSGGTFTTTGKFASFDNGTAVVHNRGDLEITGGVFDAEYQADVWYGAGTNNSTTVISGGEFRSTNVNIQGDDGTVTVTGGSFGVDPLDFVAPGYYVDFNGSFYVVGMAAETKEVSTLEELQEALADSTGTADVYVADDMAVSGSLTVPTNVTLYVKQGTTLSFEEGAVLSLEGYLMNSGTLDFSTIGSGFVSNLVRCLDQGGSMVGLPQAGEDGVYEIGTPMQLQLMHYVMLQNADASSVFHGDIILTDDLDLSGYEFLPLGYDCAVAFSGHFDGRGHTISGLTIRLASGDLGLFSVTENADFSNLTMENAMLDTQSGIMGALAGEAYGSGTFYNVSVSGSYKNAASYYCGGWFGFMSGTETDKFNFVNCTNSMDVQGCYNVGAFWGSSSGSKADVTMVNCSNSGDVSASGGTIGIVGGYVYNSVHTGTLYNFTNTGTITNQGTEVKNPFIFNGQNPPQKTQTVAACLVDEDDSITVYETAAEAVSAAGTANSTVYLTQDVQENLTVPVGAQLTVEGGGYTLSGAIEAQTSQSDSDKTSLTIRSLSMNGTGVTAPAVSSVNYGTDTADGEKQLPEVNGLSLSMQNCTVENYSAQALHLTNAEALLVDDCSFANNASDADFVVDLDLCTVQDAQITVQDSSFEDTGKTSAIRVAARGGESDAAEQAGVPHVGTEGNKAATVDSLSITGCSFAGSGTALTPPKSA